MVLCATCNCLFQGMHIVVSISGMILSNKEKNGKLCNTKSGRPAHVEDMSRARLRVSRGVWGHVPPRKFCFQHGFLDF